MDSLMAAGRICSCIVVVGGLVVGIGFDDYQAGTFFVALGIFGWMVNHE